MTIPLARKLFHATGIVIVLAYRGLAIERPLFAGILWACVGVLLAVDLLRHRVPQVQAVFKTLFRMLLDPKDVAGLNSSTLYFAGCALAVTITPADPARAGILALALGDPSAAIVGMSVRSPKFGRVSLAGSAACFVMATLGCAIFVPWPAAVVGGATAMTLEAISGSKLDNLAIPAGTALVLHLL